MNERRLAVSLALLAALATPAHAQRPADITLERGAARAVVDTLLARIRTYYVLPEVGARVEREMRRRARRGDYDSITSGLALTDTLGEHLWAIGRDRHLRFAYSPTPSPVRLPQPETPEEQEKNRAIDREDNYGLEKVERLPGNIGYLEMRRFVRPAFSGATFAAAMTFLASTDALIVDLRRNRGGDSDMVNYVASWFLGDEPVHLADLYDRPRNETWQQWSLPAVPGGFYLDRPLFLLTSKATFSAAEGLAYELQALRKVTVVGEKTRGGAHPSEWFKVHPHFSAVIPTSRVTSAVTRTNWEGVGVAPDVECPADSALQRAQVMALEAMLAKASAPGRKAELMERIESLGRR